MKKDKDSFVITENQYAEDTRLADRFQDIPETIDLPVPKFEEIKHLFSDKPIRCYRPNFLT